MDLFVVGDIGGEQYNVLEVYSDDESRPLNCWVHGCDTCFQRLWWRRAGISSWFHIRGIHATGMPWCTVRIFIWDCIHTVTGLPCILQYIRGCKRGRITAHYFRQFRSRCRFRIVGPTTWSAIFSEAFDLGTTFEVPWTVQLSCGFCILHSRRAYS